MRLSSGKLKADGSVTVSVDVRNTGKRAGDDVVQIYVQHFQSKVERPLKALEGFQRVALRPNEMKTVQIPISAAALAYWNEQKHGWEVEREPVKIMAGRSSADLLLEKMVNVE
jgi:beta-glucosidase